MYALSVPRNPHLLLAGVRHHLEPPPHSWPACFVGGGAVAWLVKYVNVQLIASVVPTPSLAIKDQVRAALFAHHGVCVSKCSLMEPALTIQSLRISVISLAFWF